MENGTTIKVPKKYEFMIESIQMSYDIWGKYAVTFLPGFDDVSNVYFADTQADALEYIQLTYQIYMEDHSTPAPAPEATAVKEDTANADTNNATVPAEQDHIPSAVAVDAPETAPTSKAAASVVDDQLILDRNQYYCRFRFPDTLKVCPALYGCIPECRPP